MIPHIHGFANSRIVQKKKVPRQYTGSKVPSPPALANLQARRFPIAEKRSPPEKSLGRRPCTFAGVKEGI